MEQETLGISRWGELLKQCHRNRIQQRRQTFQLDLFGVVWRKATDDHKRLILRLAFLEENPVVKAWSAYSESERRTLHTFGLWIEEFADFAKSVKRDAKAFERNINAPD